MPDETRRPPPHAPLRGADAVNDELEVGFDAGFEARWHKAEVAGRVVMVLAVAAALVGLLGQGPWSHSTSRAAHGTLSVDYEPVARYGTGTQVTLHLSTADALAGPEPGTSTVAVSLATRIVEPMALQLVEPQPAESRAGKADIGFTFDLPAGEEAPLVRLMLKPTAVGPVHLWVREGDEEVSWTQVIVP